jgi:dolichyl-phosphate beta-glucosyltransferase
MLTSRGAYRVYLDSDLAYPPSEIGKIVDALSAGADVAIACRWHPGSRHVVNPAMFAYSGERHIMSRVLNGIVSRALLPNIIDSRAGLKGFTADSAEEIFSRVSTPGIGFDAECLYLACQQGRRIVQTVLMVQWDDRQSTMSFGRDSVRILRNITRNKLPRKRPQGRSEHHTVVDVTCVR